MWDGNVDVLDSLVPESVTLAALRETFAGPSEILSVYDIVIDQDDDFLVIP